MNVTEGDFLLAAAYEHNRWVISVMQFSYDAILHEIGACVDPFNRRASRALGLGGLVSPAFYCHPRFNAFGVT
jgi:hypothetical protein